MSKILVKYTRYTEYEVEVDEQTKVDEWDSEWDNKMIKMIEKNPLKYEIDSWISYDDHVQL